VPGHHPGVAKGVAMANGYLSERFRVVKSTREFVVPLQFS
jgi:hypothetical protein